VAGTALAAVLVAYAPALLGDFFLFDDRGYILENPLVTSPSGLARIWRGEDMVDYWPLSFSVFWLIWQVAGATPVAFHAISLALHLGCSWVLYRVLRQCQVSFAGLAALIFALHPANSETVAWIFQIRTSLASLLLGAATMAWLAYERRPRLWLWSCALIMFALSLTAKTLAVAFPLLLIARRMPLWRLHGRRLVWEIAPFLTASLAAGSLGLLLHARARRLTDEFTLDLDAWQRLGRGILAFAFYLRQSVLPHDLSLLHPQFSWSWGSELVWIAAGALLVALLATAAAVRGRWRPSPTLFWSAAWFLTALLPVSGVVHISYFVYSPVADHYLYPALPAAIVAALHLLAKLGERRQASRRLAMPLALLLLGALFLLTRERAEIFRSEESVWLDAKAHAPASWLATYNLATVYLRAGQEERGLTLVHEALALNPDYPEAHYNLGVNAYQRGDLVSAKEHFARALRKRRMPEAYYNLAVLAHQAGDGPEAERQLRLALAVQPRFVGARHLLGVVLYRQKRLGEAIHEWQAVLRQQPNVAETHYNLGVVLSRTGHVSAARHHLASALAAPPAFDEPHFGVSIVFRQADEARQLLSALTPIKSGPDLLPAPATSDAP
jgi:tetratricopeptide (TPR) repeat protein